MKHIFIINPAAGKGKFQNIIDNINETLKNKNIDFEIYISKFKGDCKNYIINKCEENIPCVFYSCGGDGTLHDVINAAINYNHASVGVLPCGTGNDFVKNFHNNSNFFDMNAQVNGSKVKIDIIKFNNNYAATVCNMGIDADAAFNMHRFKKIPFISGSGLYILSLLYCLFKSIGKYFEFKLNNEIIKGTFLLGVAANGKYYGGGYKCAPLAIINDGLLDICIVKNISRSKILGLINSYKAGNHLDNEELKQYITYRKSKNVKITSNVPINLCADGENYLFNDVEIEILPNALNFWMPEGAMLVN